MDNYEVNVLTRKGGWKKLPQQIVSSEDESKLNSSENLNIKVTDDPMDDRQSEDINNNLFENFTEINKIINNVNFNILCLNQNVSNDTVGKLMKKIDILFINVENIKNIKENKFYCREKGKSVSKGGIRPMGFFWN